MIFMRQILFCLFVSQLTCAIALAQPIVLFPGDTNNDGVANHFDLLPIGVAYNMEGPPRQNASLNWLPQPLFPPWPGTLPVSLINKGFVDCDGNGFIDAFDIDAIVLNFDNTQNFSQPPPMPYPPKLTDTCFSCPKPDILISFDKDTIVSGEDELDTLFAYIILRYPPGVTSQNGALGIAFDVKYDYDPEKIIDSLTIAYPDTFPDNRMYVIATSTKAQLWRLPPPGAMRFATAGRGQNVFFVSDTLFTVRFIIIDMIIRDAELFSLSLSNVLIINKLEQVIGLGNIKQNPVVVVSATHSPNRRPLVLLSPNPVRETLAVESPESPIEKIDIAGTDGRLALSAEAGGQNRFDVPTGSLPPGVWLAVIQTRSGVAVKKFVKTE